MAITPVPPTTAIPPFPALSDRADGSYNNKAYLFGTHMATKFNGEIVAVAGSAYLNALEAAAKAALASDSAAVAVAAAASTQDAAGHAASALTSKNAAAQSATEAAQSATTAQQAKQAVNQALASVAGGPVISINGRTGVVNMKEFTTGDVVVTARKDYTTPDWLPMDGGLYLRTSYTALAALLPIQYPTSKMVDPSSPPSYSVTGVAISPDSLYLALGLPTAPSASLRLYKRTASEQFTSGSVVSNAPAVNAVAFSPDGAYLATASSASPYLKIHKKSGDAYNQLADPTQPSNGANAVAFSPNASYLAVALHNLAGRLALYSRSGDTFTKLSDPAGLPPSGMNGLSVAFSPDGTYLAVGTTVAPFIFIYKRAGNVFTLLANPDVLPTNNLRGVAFSYDGNYLALAADSGLLVYKRNGDSFSRVNGNPVTPSGLAQLWSVAFSPNGEFLAATCNSTATVGGLLLYRRNGDAFTAVPSPTPALGNAYSVAFSADSLTLAVGIQAAPYVVSYRVEYDTNTLFKLPVQTVDGSGLLGYVKT
ncbi:hypothetical protein B0920_02025 [Massilia sp. KIM]|uniref:WD40 repeat domain-containing protein n=1 Tax=Massilia sp. KIM TaxID=1955422 RepID=UPI00098F517D|nr:WD40 repeat domain-containing protein [Massilia sp. KIM]OON62278.1 hypothetical protein B0920_02025 [Massilia sp. KIM]